MEGPDLPWSDERVRRAHQALLFSSPAEFVIQGSGSNISMVGHSELYEISQFFVYVYISPSSQPTSPAPENRRLPLHSRRMRTHILAAISIAQTLSGVRKLPYPGRILIGGTIYLFRLVLSGS